MASLCPFCDEETFPNKVLLGRHLQRYHSEQLENVTPKLDQDPQTQSQSPQIPAYTPLSPAHDLGNHTQTPSLGTNSPESPSSSDCTPLVECHEAIFDSYIKSDIFMEKGNVSFDVTSFFERFQDCSEELYADIGHLNPPLSELGSDVGKMIHYCTKNQLTLGEAGGLFNLISSLQCVPFPIEPNSPSSLFKNSDAFGRYLDRARKLTVKREGWVRAVISSSFGINRTGVYRPVLDLMLEQLNKAGGISAIMDFQLESHCGKRIFSSPWNSEALGEYARTLRKPGHIILIDLYSDGTTLSHSGTQSATNVRVRFSNLRGQTEFWHDVGIVPTVDSSGEKRSESSVRSEKVMLLHRFTYLLFKEAIRASHVGYMFKGQLLFPRIGMGVFDQPQERIETSLKDHNSFRDCSHCLMPTKIRKSSDVFSQVNEMHAEVEQVKRRKLNGRGVSVDNRFSDAQNAGAVDAILTVQLSPTPYVCRNVYATVRRQLVVAKKRCFGENTSDTIEANSTAASKAFLDGEVKRAKAHLEEVSALEFPSALAAFAGMGSEPHCLYSSIAFDKLHVIEHGILRLIPDEAYKYFDCSKQFYGWSKGDVVNIANQRILSAPRSAQLPSFKPFRKAHGEKQAGITGKMRRELAPFLWHAVMGIQNNAKPDEDPLVQLLLMVDYMQQLLLGINRSPLFARRTSDDLDELGLLCFEVGTRAVTTLDTFVTTKLHRIMRHTVCHFIDNGCIRRGATDANETMHKDTKRAYRSTNKQLLNIAPQLLSARAKIASVEEGVKNNLEDSLVQAQLLLTRNPIVNEERQSANQHEIAELREYENGQIDERLLNMISNVCITGDSPQHNEERIISSLHPSTNLRIWTKVKSARFKATLLWWPQHQVWQTVYAGERVFKTDNRHDAIVYKHGAQEFYGIIQAIVRHRTIHTSRFALIRRLQEVEAEAGNRNVVAKYGNKRFSYVMTHEDVLTDCVSMGSFLRAAMIVPDTYTIMKVYGPKQRLDKIPDSLQDRKRMFFFELSGFKYTSLAEQNGPSCLEA